MSASAAEKSDEAEEKLASPWDEEISVSTRPVEPIKHVFSNRDARQPRESDREMSNLPSSFLGLYLYFFARKKTR
jgi:hypothetical protein